MHARFALPLVALAVLAGCGGPLSAEQLAQQADAICRSEQQRFGEVQGAKPVGMAEKLAQAEALIDVAQDEVSQLRALEAPPELETEFQRYLIAREDGIGLLVQGREAARRGDKRAYQVAQDTSVDRASVRRALADALGFQVCGPGAPSAEVQQGG